MFRGLFVLVLSLIVAGCNAGGISDLNREQTQNVGVPANMQLEIGGDSDNCDTTVQSGQANGLGCVKGISGKSAANELEQDEVQEWPVRLEQPQGGGIVGR